jgi:preprotein translocase subunit YajC
LNAAGGSGEETKGETDPMYDFFWSTAAMAQTGVPGGGGMNPGAPKSSMLPSFVLMLVLILIMYFMIMRPQMKKQKQVQEMLKALKVGDRVVTSGGIYGNVVGLKDDTVVLKIDDNVKVELARHAVAGVVSK